MTPSTLADIRAALRTTATGQPTPYALALRAANATQFRTLPPTDVARAARDLLDAARSPGGYTYGPIPAAHPSWDTDPAGFAGQEIGHTPPDDVAAAMVALAHLDRR